MLNKITIIGGGNGAHATAVDLTLRGYNITIYEDKCFIEKMQKVYNTKTIEYKGALGEGSIQIHHITTDLREAVQDSDIILVIVPAFAHVIYAQKLAPLIKEGQIIAVLPGTFGSLAFYKELKSAGKKAIVAETNTLPYATRLIGDGQIMIMSRFALKVGVMPASKTNEVMQKLNQLYDHLTPTESVIACGLSSLNPIIHVPTCILNAGRIEFANKPFYAYTEGFSDCVARTAETMDFERCAMLQKFGYEYDIVAHGIGAGVKTDDLKEAVAGNQSFSKIAIPSSFKYRYYTEDIPYGIAVWAKLAHLINVPVPIMDAMVVLGSSIMEMDCWNEGRSLEELGIHEMDFETLKHFLIEG